jgi:hypothetical protein
MTRISDRLLVQRVDDLLVIMDQSSGAEIVFDPKIRGRLVETIPVLFPAPNQGCTCEEFEAGHA